MAPSNPNEDPLRKALREFQNILSPEQKRQLLAQKAIPDAAAVFVLTAQIDLENARRRSRCVAGRLIIFLESVQQFSSVVGTFVSSNPGIAALVWGSVRFALLAAGNFSSYFDKLSTLFMNLRNHCPRYTEYQILYAHSTRLQAALCAFYASVVSFCTKALEVVQRKGFVQATTALWKPFETEFDELQKQLQIRNEEVREEISLASNQAAAQEQKLQVMEREAASEYRSIGNVFRRKANLESDEARKWRLEMNERNSRARRRRLLRALSSYDYKAAYKQVRRKRYGNTSSWLSQNHEFREWLADSQSSLFWCYGIPGSGKSVLAATVVDELFCQNVANLRTVRFFFCQYDNPESLEARTILASLVRQCLEAGTLSTRVEASLERLVEDSPPDIDDLFDLIQEVSDVSHEHVVVIDAVDECEKGERDRLLLVLRRLLASSRVKWKIFLASGPQLSTELKGYLKPNRHVSMACPEVNSDIKTYIENMIAEKEDNGELLVGQPQLIDEIQDALILGAQGMFLWVAFEIEDICAQHSDEDIRKVIRDLPKDLPEVYERVLARIERAGTAETAQKIFRWVASVKRPLSPEELREAIAIKPCQPFRKPEAVMNDINRLVPCCGNLVVFDDEEQVILFAHHTVKQFLLAKSTKPSLDKFHFQLSRADHEVGEICVTYLNLNDFERQLAKTLRPPAHLFNPDSIMKASLSTGLNIPATDRRLNWVRLGKDRTAGKVDVDQQLRKAAGMEGLRSLQKLQTVYAFLPYASEYWLYHTSDFAKENTETWHLWKVLLRAERDFAQMPWTSEKRLNHAEDVMTWIFENNHSALLRHMESSSRNAISSHERGRILVRSAVIGRLGFVEILLDPSKIQIGVLKDALGAAAGGGHLKVVEMLLAAKADVNVVAEIGGQSALQAAARGGYVEVVKTLLAAKANVNAAGAKNRGRTALQAGAEGGYLKVVKTLLAAKADVNAAAAENWGRTALQAAAEGGHLEVVKRLLAAKADVNAAPSRDRGRTALQAAAEGGHLEVVKTLLAAKADANAAAAEVGGQAALQAAAGSGYVEVVKTLLAAKANVNAAGAENWGHSALQTAAKGGYVEVVKTLLAAKADVNAAASGYLGQTALQTAANGGYVEVVKALLAAKADVNAAAPGDWGPTALYAAAEGGHLELVKTLLAAKADVNAAKFGGPTALQAAAGNGHFEVVETLLAAKADVNADAARTKEKTALQAAAQGGHLEVVKSLLAAKADVNTAAESGERTALHAAAEGGHLEVVKTLLAAKADVNNIAAGEFGEPTALHAAARNGDLEMVETLVAAKADVNAAAAENWGRTALQVAAEGGHLEVVKTLLAAKAAAERRHSEVVRTKA